jgi:hypothetical protein
MIPGKLVTFSIYSLGCLLLTVTVLVNGRSTNKYKELKPVLIKSVVSHPNYESPPPHSQSSQEEEEGLTSRKIYQFPGTIYYF